MVLGKQSVIKESVSTSERLMNLESLSMMWYHQQHIIE